MSVRQRRRVSNGSGDFTCPVCRSLGQDESYLVVTQEYRDFWLEHHSVEWIAEVANGIWPRGEGVF